MTTELWDRETFVEKLRTIGVRAYHDKHPFHIAMNEGRLSQESVRGWVANRFYYQQNIPIKDAAILANCPVRQVRQAWIHRILDHDGVSSGAVESTVLSGESAAPHAAIASPAVGSETHAHGAERAIQRRVGPQRDRALSDPLQRVVVAQRVVELTERHAHPRHPRGSRQQSGHAGLGVRPGSDAGFRRQHRFGVDGHKRFIAGPYLQRI